MSEIQASFRWDEGMTKNSGVKVVLTASATEMSEFYNNPFVAFVAGFPKAWYCYGF
jgi:hypothetical protein